MSNSNDNDTSNDDSIATVKDYTLTDMEESMSPLRKGTYKQQFLSTFQPVKGFPNPSPESKQIEHVHIQYFNSLRFYGKGTWSLPHGAVTMATKDPAFASILLGAFLAKKERFWRDEWELFCEGCHKKARDKTVFVVPRWGPSRNLLRVGVHFRCGQRSCDRKLRKGLMASFQLCCAHCLKPESRTPKETKIFTCGRSKARFFCSKTCRDLHLGKSC